MTLMLTKQWNSSVMKFKNDKLHNKIWRKFIGNEYDFLRRFAGDRSSFLTL